METVVIGDPGKDWTDKPRALTPDEARQIREVGLLTGVRLHREFTNSTLDAAISAVRALQNWR